MQTRHLKALALAISLMLGGCAIPQPPDQAELQKQALGQVEMPAGWKQAKTAGEFDRETLGFALPPELQQLIRDAQAHNPDLQLAANRVEQAHSATKAAGASLWPTLGIGAQAGDATVPSSTLALNGLAIVANWELDIWGKNRSAQAASKERALSAELDALYARQSIAAAVVKAWLAAVEARGQIELAQAMVGLADKQLALVQVGKKVGRNAQQDVVMGQIALRNYRAQLIQSQQALNSAQRALDILVGRYPSADAEVVSRLPVLNQPIPAGLPSALAERRPDLQAAEARFRAAFYDVEVARKARLPSISLMAGFGVVDNNLLVLQEDLSNPLWGGTARILAPLFMGGALDAQIEVKTAKQQEATIGYAKAMLNALNEIEGGLYADQKLEERQTLLHAVVADQQQLVDLQRVQLRVGKGDQYQLNQQQLALATSRMNLLRIENERLIQRVNLHLSLGGVYRL
ncbi:TolC family protein [Jeongeupia wiesaeckerbachi]|uniref:TolC family protein n=1 Tax=Jeongeupia wiesaeckerbachi TaxID=3051218 RepID=UPI003D806213